MILISSLFGRENPFFPVDSTEAMPLTSNQVKRAPELKRATISLPSTARTLESVTVEFTNLDGSVGTKKIQLHNSIDWHLPLFISQNYNLSPEKPKVKKLHTVKKELFKKIAGLPFIQFYADGKKLKIVTKDTMLRNFLLVKPHRIVCDFKRQTDFGSYVKKGAKGSIFKEVRVGTHNGYYRVVIELDGYYQYELTRAKSAYIFTLL
jgi:hypothetical protein